LWEPGSLRLHHHEIEAAIAGLEGGVMAVWERWRPGLRPPAELGCGGGALIHVPHELGEEIFALARGTTPQR
jgi:hypothetical protein